MRNLVIFWGRKNQANKALDYSTTPASEALFVELLDKMLKSGIQTYFCRDQMGFLGKNRYICEFKFNSNKSFDDYGEVVEPNIVWDKSVGQMFPVVGDDSNVINSNAFKTLVSNKWFSYLSYPEYFPKSVIFNSNETFNEAIKKLNSKKVVIKPVTGYGGYGVELIERDNPVIKENLFNSSNMFYLAQNFIETDTGIKGIIEGKHDLRLVIVNGKIVKSFLRTPKSGDFRSNWAQGGTFNQVLLEKLPMELLNFTAPLISDIVKKYNNPLFAIDVANTNNGFKIIELTGSAVSFADNMEDERQLWFSELIERFLR